MGLNWNEIKSRALLFSKTWADACNENSQAKPFWIDFFEIFGITDKRVGTFEQHVKKLGGKRGFMDLFWPGVLLVEQQFGFHGFQVFHVDSSRCFNTVSMALRGVVCVFFTNTCSTSKVRALHSDGLIFNLFAK